MTVVSITTKIILCSYLSGNVDFLGKFIGFLT